jgi:hypothetical protein
MNILPKSMLVISSLEGLLDFLGLTHLSLLVNVYLSVDFLLLIIDIMQTLLNTLSFALYPPLQRMLLNTKSGLLSVLMLLLLVGAATQARAQVVFNDDYVIINGTKYATNNNNATRLPSSLSGNFNRDTDNLLLSGEANTSDKGNFSAQSVQLLYRVYRSGTAVTSSSPAFVPVNLVKGATTGNGNNTSTKWSSATQPNILTSTTGTTTPTTYVLEFFFQANQINKQNAVSSVYDNANSPNNYRITFNVVVSSTAPPVATWNGSSANPDWFNSSNWTFNGPIPPNGVPNSSTDVTIPYLSGRSFPVVGAGPSGNPAQARNITIQGQSATAKATILINGGELQAFGNIDDPFGGLSSTATGIMTLASLAPNVQTFNAGHDLYVVHIQGGGEKILLTRLPILASLDFVRDKGKLTTRTDNDVSYGIALDAGAVVSGEDENGYVSGYLTSTRSFAGGPISTDFGNIGVVLDAPYLGQTIAVSRLTGASYTGVGPTPTSVSINRSFDFTVPNASNTTFNLTFKYLNAELNNNTAADLAIYSSPVNSTTFSLLGRTSLGNKSVTIQNATSSLASTFTLGGTTVPLPLPVTLVSFTATPTPQGAALLRWVTAKELNNKGFGIERTLDATGTWKEVNYVATTNTPNGKSYEYTDNSLITAPASTQAYYRLRQEDLDGKVTYSPVAAVARQAALASTGIVLSPVPLDGPNLSVSFAEAGQAGQEVAIINTQGQRMLHFTTQNNAEGTLSLPVANLAAGVYIVRIQTPGQAVRHARFVKL